jgi:hypothetical protein
MPILMTSTKRGFEITYDTTRFHHKYQELSVESLMTQLLIAIITPYVKARTFGQMAAESVEDCPAACCG